MPSLASDIKFPHSTIERIVDPDFACDVISKGRHIELDATVRDLLPQIGIQIGQQIKNARLLSSGCLARMCVITAFSQRGELGSADYQHRCDVARTLYEHTHDLLRIETAQ
ncbi:hypothetical protein [Burkholderia vietnamiensis]|uniref:hypothetical protein n=1 Tax=Burkholderia vietnamiensis TaxID=60552 RepID=UPI001CF161A8|nr:hypothetical protein [Burkholderia vietnamiensis]MCA8197327.1 hypothetical protein [Burkholderia vietnamiensis]UEC05611.1 hypothetical protein LK462_34815 [Burkholderia vietnamiensis]